MNAKIITAAEQYKLTTLHAATAKEAAEMLGVSETTVRSIAKRLGVRQISGRAVAGFVLFSQHPVDVALSFYR